MVILYIRHFFTHNIIQYYFIRLFLAPIVTRYVRIKSSNIHI